MIVSVIARFECDNDTQQRALAEIESHPAMETGQLVDNRLLPITIDSDSNESIEELTRWITTVGGVSFVDVVFVHGEESDSITNAPKPKRRHPA